jgi:hypothetical protein
MGTLKRVLVAALILFFCQAPAIAQESDFGTWISVELEKKLTDKLRLEFEEEIRIFQNFSEIDRFGTSLGASWTFNKFIRIGTAYSWLYKNRVSLDDWEHRHRLVLYARGRIKVDRFTLTLRERFQSTYRDESIEGFKYNPRNYLRSRMEASYDIKGSKIAPYLSTEMYYQLNNPKGNEIDNMRYTVGAEWPFSQTLTIDNFIRLDREMNAKNPLSMWIAGIAFKLGW